MGRQIFFMAGTSSIFVPSRNEKYLIQTNHAGLPLVREWPDLDGEVYFMTGGEAARTELKRSFPDVKKIGWAGKSINLFDWRWPMAYSGAYNGEAVYTDLVGAYHQIYRDLWLDCCYPRGRGVLSLRTVAERLSSWKVARNSVIGVIRSRQSFGYRGGRRFKLFIQNPFLSPHLWATVQGVLNEIAYVAIQTGALYIATDGYIHPIGEGALSFQKFLADFSLEFRSLAGNAEIRGWGNYKVGEKETKIFSQNRWQGQRNFLSLDLPDRSDTLKLTRWLRKDLQR